MKKGLKHWWKPKPTWLKSGLIALMLLALAVLYFMVFIMEMHPVSKALFGVFTYPIGFIMLWGQLGIFVFPIGALIGLFIDVIKKRFRER